MTYASASELPATAILEQGLTRVFAPTGSGGEIRVLKRTANIHASSLPSEFVTCQIASGRRLELFCKYTGDDFEDCHGHRAAAGHEAEVYQRLVNPLGVAAPRCHGACPGLDGGGTWLFLEALPRVERVTEEADQHPPMVAAAREIGHFHAACAASRVGDDAAAFLHAYDRDYYLGWGRRTAEYAGPWHDRCPWLATLCRRCDHLFDPLLNAPQTVIHGELYPHNVLCRDGRVFLIDWQSAAIGPGEIDLATLTEKWPADVAQPCQAAYVHARWPDGPPTAFEATLAAARLYLVFRWLGDRPEWTTSPRSEWGFEQLRRLAERLGLIQG